MFAASHTAPQLTHVLTEVLFLLTLPSSTCSPSNTLVLKYQLKREFSNQSHCKCNFGKCCLSRHFWIILFHLRNRIRLSYYWIISFYCFLFYRLLLLFCMDQMRLNSKIYGCYIYSTDQWTSVRKHQFYRGIKWGCYSKIYCLVREGSDLKG